MDGLRIPRRPNRERGAVGPGLGVTVTDAAPEATASCSRTEELLSDETETRFDQNLFEQTSNVSWTAQNDVKSRPCTTVKRHFDIDITDCHFVLQFVHRRKQIWRTRTPVPLVLFGQQLLDLLGEVSLRAPDQPDDGHHDEDGHQAEPEGLVEHPLAQGLVRYVQHPLLAPRALPPRVTAALEAVAFLDAHSATLAGVSFAGFALLFASRPVVARLAVALVTRVGELAGAEDARLQFALGQGAEKACKKGVSCSFFLWGRENIMDQLRRQCVHSELNDLINLRSGD
jgi:hypothetical protein